MKKGTSDNPLVNDILNQKGVTHNLALAELVGTELESGQRGNAPYNSGGAAGGFQIQLGAHPGVTAKEAETPSWAVRYMHGAYAASVKRVGAKAFKANPEQAAEEAAYGAEKPEFTYYKGQGVAHVDTAFAIATHELSGTQLGVKLYPKHKPLPIVGATKLVKPEVPYAVDKFATNAYAQKNARRAALELYKQGARGEALLLALATFGAETKGTYEGTPSKAYKGSEYYSHGSYTGYLSSSLIGLRDAGHPGHLPSGAEASKQHLPGFFSPSGVSVGEVGGVIKHDAGDVVGAVTSLPDLLKWISDPSNLVRIGMVIVGLALVLIGFDKLSGLNALPVPV